jgi:ABC-type branched-subunit amino acid transport system ATPase component
MHTWAAESVQMDDGRRVQALSVRGLTSGYGRVRIIHDIALEIVEGEVVSIFGRNGAGKTTLLKSIMGILQPSSGQIILNADTDLKGKPSNCIATEGVGYVPQGRAIFPALSVLENLRVAQYALDASGGRVDEVIEMFGALKPHLRARGGSLSGGQQQLLALARALVGSPTLLLLDEPSEGIQPSILESIVEILTALMEQTSLSILLVEQNLEFAASLAHRGYLMEMGKITRALDKFELSRQLARNLLSAT